MRLSAIWQLCASWFAGDTTVDATPLRSITGLLVSKGAVVPVYDEDIHGAFDEMYEYAGERMYDMVRQRSPKATHYRLTKGGTVTRECTVRVSGEEVG